MFNSKKEKLAIGIIVLLIILIPTGSFILAARFKAQNNHSNPYQVPQTSPKEVPETNPLDELKKNTESGALNTNNNSPQVSFGPTLNFKLNIEGRPASKQASRVFLGIASGQPQINPQYLLSFTIDVADSGEYTGLSLAGLTSGSTYSAYIKGSAQIASASAFLVKPAASDIGTLNLITGDLNEDNVINSLDYAVAKNAFGANSSSKNWNPNVDFNLDGVVNIFDLGIIIKNFGKTGNAGVWVSTPVATQSGSLNLSPSSGSPTEATNSLTPKPPPGSKGGYWMWFPTP